MTPRGAWGYAKLAETLASRYETVSFTEVHPELHLPPVPARVLDIGSGTGRDAAFLAQLGYDVTAVEPVAEMRAAARRLHKEPITWLTDALPLLAHVSGPFDLILVTAVWMHLDTQERAQAMPRVAGLLAPGGRLALSLRHGPVPEGRVMHDVSAVETISLAKSAGLGLVSQTEGASVQGANRAAGVNWTRLTFRQ